jgi:hypothetical protein
VTSDAFVTIGADVRTVPFDNGLGTPTARRA